MSRIRITGIIIFLCGVAINSIINNEIAVITGAVIIGLGIGVALTGRYGNKTI